MHPSTFKASYRVLKEEKLVIEVFAGIMTLDNYKFYKQKQSEDTSFSPHYNLFVDMQDVLLDGTVDQVEAYVDFVIKNGHIVGKRRNATVVNTLNQQVHAHIFAKLHQNEKLPQEFQLFTDTDTAVAWISSDLIVDVIKAIVTEFKIKPLFVFQSSTEY